MSKKRTYQHLSPEERAVIMIERQNGNSLREIARRTQRSAATISRELTRAGCRSASDPYNATAAGQAYDQRRQRCRRKPRLQGGSLRLSLRRFHGSLGELDLSHADSSGSPGIQVSAKSRQEESRGEFRKAPAYAEAIYVLDKLTLSDCAALQRISVLESS